MGLFTSWLKKKEGKKISTILWHKLRRKIVQTQKQMEWNSSILIMLFSYWNVA